MAGNREEFFTRVAFFAYLEPEEREEMLRKRLIAVDASRQYLRRLQQMANSDQPTEYAQRVLAFHIQQIENEYQWLSTWLAEMQGSN
jgi:hypothetical protein